MADFPLISIVLPTYNGETYLAEAIDSCLAQSHSNWELIIVDDHSTDGTPKLVASYEAQDRRIRVVRNEANSKLPASLNRGFRMANGVYLTWISDDNRFRPHALEVMLRFLKERDGTDFVYSDFTTIDNHGLELQHVRVGEPRMLPIKNTVGPCWLFRKSVWERLSGFDEELFLVEDYDFALRAFCQFRITPLHEDLYLYREHNASLTSKRSKDVVIAKVHLKERNLLAIKRRDRRCAAACHVTLIDPLLARNDARRARHHAVGALLCAPLYSICRGRYLLLAALLGPSVIHIWTCVRSNFAKLFAPNRDS